MALVGQLPTLPTQVREMPQLAGGRSWVHFWVHSHDFRPFLGLVCLVVTRRVTRHFALGGRNRTRTCDPLLVREVL